MSNIPNVDKILAEARARATQGPVPPPKPRAKLGGLGCALFVLVAMSFAVMVGAELVALVLARHLGIT
jgi:hypothetical protein